MLKKQNGDEEAENSPFSLELDPSDQNLLSADWNFNDRAEIIYRAGHRMMERGFFKEAAETFERASRYDEAHYDAYAAQSEALVMCGQTKAALDILTAAADRFGRNCAIGAALGHVYLHSGHYDEAMQCVEIATSKDPDSGYTWVIAGEARLQLQVAEALKYADECFDRALASIVPWPQVDLRIALAFCEWGPRSRARRLLESITQKNPGIPLGWVLLGDTYRLSGRERDAKQCYKIALDLVPGLQAARRAIGFGASAKNFVRNIKDALVSAIGRMAHS